MTIEEKRKQIEDLKIDLQKAEAAGMSSIITLKLEADIASDEATIKKWEAEKAEKKEKGRLRRIELLKKYNNIVPLADQFEKASIFRDELNKRRPIG